MRSVCVMGLGARAGDNPVRWCGYISTTGMPIAQKAKLLGDLVGSPDTWTPESLALSVKCRWGVIRLDMTRSVLPPHYC